MGDNTECGKIGKWGSDVALTVPVGSPPPFSIGAKVAIPMPVAISCRALGMLWIGNA